MPIRVIRLGDPRLADEGLRIGTVRRPPRCYCVSEELCHRSILRDILLERGAVFS
ncbi:MAG: hypothetical protein ACHQM4_11150 [Thermoanaerobaculia bacterium]